MSVKNIKTGVLAATLFLTGLNASAADYQYPIAGLNPDIRPAGAPMITDVLKGNDWYSSALRGVSQPYPSSLIFLEDQGNWYNPFMLPGMPGRYDLRQFHAPRNQAPQ